MEDREIVRMFLDRREEAIRESQQKYARYLHTIAFSVLGDEMDAAECENDAYLGAWNSIPPNEPEDLKTYLGKLVRRIAIDVWRKKHAEKRGGNDYALSLDELEECVGTSRDPVLEEVEANALTELLDRFLRSLPDTERRVFLRRYWYAEPQHDIAERFGFKETRIRTMLFRTRVKLKAFLEKEGVYL